jgi:hypothetical protein
MGNSLIKIISIYTPELIIWIGLPLGASILLSLITQHLVSRSAASRFSPYPLMRKVIDRALVRHSVWVSQTIFTFFIVMFVVLWALIQGSVRHKHAHALVQTLIERSGELASDGPEFVLEAPFNFEREYQRSGDKSLTAYAFLGVEYYSVTSQTTGKKFEVVLPRDIGSVHAERLLKGKVFNIAGETAVFSQESIRAIRRSLRHPVRLEWLLLIFSFVSVIPTGLLIASVLAFVFTLPASAADRVWRKQLIRVIQRKVITTIEPAITGHDIPLSDFKVAQTRTGAGFYIVKFASRKQKVAGRIVDLITPGMPWAAALIWKTMRITTLIFSLGMVRGFGYAFLPNEILPARPVVQTKPKSIRQ